MPELESVDLYKTAVDLMHENDSLKEQLKVALKLQNALLDDLKIEKHIKVTYRIGTGTEKDPVRVIHSYWDLKGQFLFSSTE